MTKLIHYTKFTPHTQKHNKMIKDYIDLLSGYLTNHFKPYDSYFEGVEDAILEFNNDPIYFEEMKKVFQFFLKEQNFEQNLLRDIVRNNANYFVSNDAAALKKLRFIYEDTILQEKDGDYNEIEEQEELVELKFDPITMNIDSLKQDIFNDDLDYETRINAALLFRQSNDNSFIPTLLKAIQEKDNNLRCGFVIVLIWGKHWDKKIELLSSLLLTDSYSNIRKSIAYYLGEKGKQYFNDSPSTVDLLIEALREEQHISVINSIIRALANYKSIALNMLLNNFDYAKEKNCNLLNKFLSEVDKNILITKLLLPLVDSPNKQIKIIVIKHLGECYFPEVSQRLNILLNDKNLSTKIQHYTEMSLKSVQKEILNQ